ncbi:helix-turn-helix domain-containing protein [Methylobacterium sp. JK268]
MTNTEFRIALAALGLTPSAAARLLRVDVRRVRRWEGGETAVPGTIAAFLRLLLALGVSGEEAMRLSQPAAE